MENKPETIGEYKAWLKDVHNYAVDAHYEAYFDSVSSRVKRIVEVSEFWSRLFDDLEQYNEEYQLRTGYPLFAPGDKPRIFEKTFESFLLKTYRKDILENTSWPSAPEGEWILPNNWFSRINDIVRTLIVVKYFDGVEFVISKIDALCKEQNLDCYVSYEAREEGYYAAHAYVKRSYEIPKINWDTERVEIPFEIQITTQLQEVIRKLLHKYYEQRRKMVKKPTEKWQWNFRCDEFGANYLGHILHYVEGMIMEIRERQKEASP